jgi:hemoglobin
VFVRYGGFASVSRVVSDFYGRMMESDIMRPYFVDVDMARLIDHQTKFFASMMGGPASFSDEHLERVHAHLGITDPAFQELGLLLRETLEDHDFDESDIALVMSEVMARRPVIVAGG